MIQGCSHIGTSFLLLLVTLDALTLLESWVRPDHPVLLSHGDLKRDHHVNKANGTRWVGGSGEPKTGPRQWKTPLGILRIGPLDASKVKATSHEVESEAGWARWS